jgi:hypothetical protein
MYYIEICDKDNLKSHRVLTQTQLSKMLETETGYDDFASLNVRKLTDQESEQVKFLVS